jgi:WD40 repeat protein
VSRPWVALCWPQWSPRIIYCSDVSGGMWAYQLPASDGGRCFGRPASQMPRTTVFGICASSLPDHEGLLISVSMDRQIICWRQGPEPGKPPPPAGKPPVGLHHLWNISGLGGSVAALAVSPAQGLVGFGGGDGALRLWNTKKKSHPYSSVQLWKGIPRDSILTAVAWHPRRALLAYGTQNGFVGVYDCAKCEPLTEVTQASGPTLALCWVESPTDVAAPAVSATESELLVLTEGAAPLLRGFSDAKLKDAVVSLDKDVAWVESGAAAAAEVKEGDSSALSAVASLAPEVAAPASSARKLSNTSVTSAALSPDGLHLAVGYRNGAVSVLRRESSSAPFAVQLRLHEQLRPVRSVQWRLAGAAGAAPEPLWLAVLVEDGSVVVFDVQALVAQASLGRKPFATLRSAGGACCLRGESVRPPALV